MSCPVCAADAVRPKLRKDGVDILQCRRCGLAWWEPGPGVDPAALYDAGYFASREAGVGYDDYAGLEAPLRRTVSARLSRLGAPAAGERLLDVGAAYGFTSSEAMRAGWRVAAVEISREAAARAAGILGRRIVAGSALALPFESGAFSVATLWDVLEHLPDPHRAASELRRVLRPGGRLALTTGDVGSAVARLSGRRWHLYTLPEHLFFYSRESLRRLLAAHGFRVERMAAEASWYPAGYLVERLRKTLLRRAATRPARWPGARVPLPVNLFDVVSVTAVREGGA